MTTIPIVRVAETGTLNHSACTQTQEIRIYVVLMVRGKV